MADADYVLRWLQQAQAQPHLIDLQKRAHATLVALAARAEELEALLAEKRKELAVAYGDGRSADEAEWFSALDRTKAERDAALARAEQLSKELDEAVVGRNAWHNAWKTADHEREWQIEVVGRDLCEKREAAEARLEDALQALRDVLEVCKGEGSTRMLDYIEAIVGEALAGVGEPREGRTG